MVEIWAQRENLRNICHSHFSANLKMVLKHLGKRKQQPYDMQQKLPNYHCESTSMEIESFIT